jgi:hypothetical protein
MARLAASPARRAASARAACVGGVAAAATLAACSATGPREGGGPSIAAVAQDPGSGRVAFEVRGLDPKLTRSIAAEDWSQVFAVRVVQSDGTADVPPIAGKYAAVGDGTVVRFEPRFPLSQVSRVRAELVPPHGGEPLVEEFDFRYLDIFDATGDVRPERTRVLAVYPSIAVLPANLLKFYLHFSAPMAAGEAYRRIQILDADGKAVEHPFLELDDELWSRDGTRLTVFFDPGRVKRELLPHEEVGAPLESGKWYTLVVDAAWRDARGKTLGVPFRRVFRVVEDDHQPPDSKDWTLEVPAAASRAPLTVRFPEPLDHALLERLLWVRGPDGVEVEGKVEIADHERLWRFTPAAPWAAGAHQLVTESILEDLAGNSIGRPFEVDLFDTVRTRVESKTVTVDFTVGASGDSSASPR